MGQSRWFNHAQRFPVTLQQPTFLTTAGLCRDGPFPDVALRQPTIRHLVGGYLEGLGHRETEPGCDLEKGSSKRTGRASVAMQSSLGSQVLFAAEGTCSGVEFNVRDDTFAPRSPPS